MRWGGVRERIHVPHTNSSTVENSEVFRTRSPFNSSRNPKPKTWELSVIACHPSGPHPPAPLSPSLPPSSFSVSGSQKIGYCVENYYMDPFASSLYSRAILDTRLRAVSACSRTGGVEFRGDLCLCLSRLIIALDVPPCFRQTRAIVCPGYLAAGLS